MYAEDFRRMLAQAGCADFRVLSSTAVPILDAEIDAKIGMVRFTSRTMRAFKLDLEDRCEDFGQIATYRGTIPGHPHGFDLDDHHHFETGRPLPVCGNTAAMLNRTRFAPHFRIQGDDSVHFGLFDCGPNGGLSTDGPGQTGSCC
jgi:hypothetical protein